MADFRFFMIIAGTVGIFWSFRAYKGLKPFGDDLSPEDAKLFGLWFGTFSWGWLFTFIVSFISIQITGIISTALIILGLGAMLFYTSKKQY